ncbi:cytochrome aa3 quinol oxidase subunit II [Paraliobacillus zengyii]|uniref:cytochrome aa3 quinol oxidase subunit II n=1 Tax=Paraliobacillus zengyii TaxID=2213194 RepID=UPI000DD3A3D8|nr:cytochrome aa3 quinol oxidase subunit II [Paraliobacillus zengyii]
MKRIRTIFYITAILLATLTLTGCESTLTVFDPQGPVARNLTELIIFSIIFMLLIVIVVFVLFGFIVWKYRAKPENEDYEPPHEEGSTALEITWFLIPVLIVVALTIPTIITISDVEDIPEGYDDQEPLVIHVTSADWKWIFSYPEQDIETVNYVNIPADRPIQFKMTSAGTMQSFWVPSLAGQKYTMANMQTQLYLVADRPGEYIGRNTNFNGEGYAHMSFEVVAESAEDFNEWVSDVKNTANVLTEDEYREILTPSIIGRKTYNETHLQWIDHAHGGSEEYINPEDYETHLYEQEGEIDEEDSDVSITDTETDEEQDESESEQSNEEMDMDESEHEGHDGH